MVTWVGQDRHKERGRFRTEIWPPRNDFTSKTTIFILISRSKPREEIEIATNRITMFLNFGNSEPQRS